MANLNTKRLWNIIINQPLSASPTNAEILGLFKHVVIALGAQMAEPEIPKKREIAKTATKAADISDKEIPAYILAKLNRLEERQQWEYR